MEIIKNFFDINQVFFTVYDYPMSYLEFFGTIFTIWCVYLTAKAKILSWPIGLVGVILYIFLFYQIQLYADLFEQVYFLITGILGWWVWLHPKTSLETKNDFQLKISRNRLSTNLVYIGIIAVATALLTYITSHLDKWLPQYFAEPAAFPFLDAFTTTMSFAAQWLLAKKKLETWILWIAVDVIGIWLYWAKGVKFIALEYTLFFFIAIWGLNTWLKEYRGYKSRDAEAA